MKQRSLHFQRALKTKEVSYKQQKVFSSHFDMDFILTSNKHQVKIRPLCCWQQPISEDSNGQVWRSECGNSVWEWDNYSGDDLWHISFWLGQNLSIEYLFRLDPINANPPPWQVRSRNVRTSLEDQKIFEFTRRYFLTMNQCEIYVLHYDASRICSMCRICIIIPHGANPKNHKTSSCPHGIYVLTGNQKPK